MGAAGAEGDVLEDVEVGEQSVVLEDRVDRPAVGLLERDVAAGQPDGAGRRRLQARDHPQGRGLAAPRRARAGRRTSHSVRRGRGDLETTDVSQLLEAGYKFPEIFKVKAEDGITDFYGVMHKPFDFDPSRKYPLIEFVYPGPQTEEVNKTFSPKSPNVPLAQLGFIVIEVGARGGSPQRNKWYDSYGYGNLRDYGLADKKVAAERLAAIHPYIDLSGVGMWGHSGGGFMTAAALMEYPDFYKAGWV